MTPENTTAVRRADSTEMLRYRMTRDLDPSSTTLSFSFISSTGTAHTAAGEWFHYDNTDEEQGCTGWYARVNIGPAALALPAGNYRVTLTVVDGPEAAKYGLGGLLIVAAA